MKIKPNPPQLDDFSCEALIVVCNELVGLLVRRAVIDRNHRESGGLGALQPSDIEYAYCTLTDKSNIEPIENVRKKCQSLLDQGALF